MSKKKKALLDVNILQDVDFSFECWANEVGYSAQYEFMNCDADISVFCAGVGTGKSTCGGAWAIQQMLKYPQADGMICANTYDQLVNASMKSMFYLLDEISTRHGKKIYKWNAQAKILQIDAPGYTGKIYCRSLDGKAGALLGFEVLWIWVDEVLRTHPETYDILSDRNRQKVHSDTGEVYGPATPLDLKQRLEAEGKLVKNQMKLTTTPDFLGARWLYDLIYDSQKIAKREEAGVALKEYKAKTLENPHLTAQKKAQYAAKYDGAYAKQQLEGEWSIIPDGAGVYTNEFSTYSHLDEFEYNPYKPLILGIDFGRRNPACIFAQEDSEDRLVILSEYQGHDLTTKEFISTVLDTISANYTGLNKELEIYCDTAGSHKESQSGESNIDVLRMMMGTAPTHKWMDIKDSIELVRERMSSMKAGRPKVMFDRRTTQLIQEALLGGYHWPQGSNGVVRENPVKDDYYDHLMDCLRYIIANKYSRTSDQIFGRKRAWKQSKTHNLIRYKSRY